MGGERSVYYVYILHFVHIQERAVGRLHDVYGFLKVGIFFFWL